MPKAIRVEKTCDHCGATFLVKPSRNHRRFCSRACLRSHESAHGRPAAMATITEFQCKTCGGPFHYKPAYLTEYRKKYGKDPAYCSIACSAIGRRADTEARNTFVCLQCGKTNPMRRYAGERRTVYYRQQKFCDNQCKSDWQRAQFCARFDAGDLTRRIKRGYVVVRIPTAPGKPRREMLEHRYVMEQFLGRPLRPDETVHHKRAWDKTTNTLDNLELRTGNHGPGGAVEDLVPWCIEILELYRQFVTLDQANRLTQLGMAQAMFLGVFDTPGGGIESLLGHES